MPECLQLSSCDAFSSKNQSRSEVGSLKSGRTPSNCLAVARFDWLVEQICIATCAPSDQAKTFVGTLIASRAVTLCCEAIVGK